MPFGMSTAAPWLTRAAIALAFAMARAVGIGLGLKGTGKLVNSPLLDSGVMVAIVGSDRAVAARRSMNPRGTTVSALSRMTLPALTNRKARLTAPTKPMLVALVRTVTFGRRASRAR